MTEVRLHFCEIQRTSLWSFVSVGILEEWLQNCERRNILLLEGYQRIMAR